MSNYHSEADTAVKLREIESKYELFQYTMDGYSAWRILRGRAASLLHTLPFQKVAHPSKLKRFVSMFFRSCASLGAFLSPKKAKYVVKTASSDLREKENGLWKDVVVDDLLKEVPSFYKIEVENNPLFADRRKTALLPISLTTGILDLLSLVFSKLFCTAEIKKVADQISQVLIDEPELSSLDSKSIKSELNYFYWSKRNYKWLLRHISPELVLVADPSEQAIRAAARELGIHTVELQHGIFTPNHQDALPGLALPYKKKLNVPDRLFLFGDYWRKGLESTGFYSDELRVVGNIRIDHYRALRNAYKQQNPPDETCCIVLTTQGFAVPDLIGFISRFDEMAAGHLNYKLYIKLHPGYDRDRSIYDTVFDSRAKITVVAAKDDPATFELLTQADLHLSISSACHFDALGMRLPTVILGLKNHEIVLHLVESGHANLAETPEDLFRIVKNWRALSVKSEVSEFYFKAGALDNIKQELGLQ